MARLDKNALLKVFEKNRDRYIKEWRELLRFESIGGDSSHKQDCVDCASWLLDKLSAMGFESKLLATAGNPVVYGRRKGRDDAVRVLFYGHYDVQPVDPIDQWTSPPFEPEFRDGRMYGRGAQDNKGQLLYALCAVQELIDADALGVDVSVIIEGEEETGSKSLTQHLADWHELLNVDILLVTDTGCIRPGIPTIVMGLRGIIHLTAEVKGANHDLHSGMHGGLAPNAAVVAANLIGSLYNTDGSIAVAGFYNGVVAPAEHERELANLIEFDREMYIEQTGVPPVAGETGFTPQERLGLRPSLDVNGIHSGYGGQGAKTIIPATATLKISARLVPNQNPEVCLNALINHLQNNCPAGFRCEITEKAIGGGAVRLDAKTTLIEKARVVLNQLGTEPAALLWEGASIPVIPELIDATQAEPLLVGFGYEKDNIHAPNESFSIEQFRDGFCYVGLILQDLAE